MPASLISGLKDLRAALGAFDARIYSGADCAVLAEELAATEKACATARMLTAARAVSTGAHKERGFSDGADWMARHTGSTGSQARHALDTAKHLDEHPETKEALVAGDISLAQAQEIAQTPGAESDLLGVARGGDLSKLREAARELRQSQVDPAELRRRQFASREFRHWQDRDGMVRFAGALPPETGLPLVRRVETAAGRLHRAAKKTANESGGRVERFDAYAADALVSLTAGDNDVNHARNVDLVIVSDLNAWRRGHSLSGEVCHIIGGGPIPVDVAKQLAGDPFLKAVIHDGTDILLVKHFGRHIPAARLWTWVPRPGSTGDAARAVAGPSGSKTTMRIPWRTADPRRNRTSRSSATPAISRKPRKTAEPDGSAEIPRPVSTNPSAGRSPTPRDSDRVAHPELSKGG